MTQIFKILTRVRKSDVDFWIWKSDVDFWVWLISLQILIASGVFEFLMPSAASLPSCRISSHNCNRSLFVTDHQGMIKPNIRIWDVIWMIYKDLRLNHSNSEIHVRFEAKWVKHRNPHQIFELKSIFQNLDQDKSGVSIGTCNSKNSWSYEVLKLHNVSCHTSLYYTRSSCRNR